MRQAILSDLHSKLEAAQACVTHARSQGVTHSPVSVTASAMAPIRRQRSTLPHLLMIRGNHDEVLFRDVDFAMAGLRAAARRCAGT